MQKNLNKVFPYILTSVILFTFTIGSGFSGSNHTSYPYEADEALIQNPDSLKQKGTRFLPIEEKSNNPFLDPDQEKGINLDTDNYLEYTAEYDHKTGKVNLYRKIGNINIKLPYSMTLEEFQDEETRKSMISYWDARAREVSEDGKFNIFNPKINLGADGLDNLFGSNLINIKPQGMAELKIGITTNKIDNPTLQENLRNTTTFDFQEKIQMNIQGNIGDKLKLGINYNTEATFEFENEMKLEYEGKEDDILQSVEAGNVSLPLPGTLITGSQSLFGLKNRNAIW